MDKKNDSWGKGFPKYDFLSEEEKRKYMSIDFGGGIQTGHILITDVEELEKYHNLDKGAVIELLRGMWAEDQTSGRGN